ncbi:MAG: beta-galactosidase [Chloroflexi bacterium]|nr:beta-galactosidase [Chloroflexota bacterium]
MTGDGTGKRYDQTTAATVPRSGRVTRRRLLASGLGLGLVLAACGSPAAPTSKPAGTTPAAPTKPAAAAPKATNPGSAAATTPAAVPDPRVDPVTVANLGYGMNVWLYNHEQNDKVLGLVREAGFGWARQWVPWSDHEPERGKMRFGELDPIVDAALRNKVKLMLVVLRSPTWATPDGKTGLPANPSDFAVFMKAMAARYKGKVSAYEVWNEQNLGHETAGKVDAKAYVDLLRVVYPAIKQADPKAGVIFGGLTPTGVNNPAEAIDDVVYLEQCYQINSGEVRQYFDILGAHAGSNNNPPEALWPDQPGPGPNWKDHPSFYFRRVEGLRAVMEKFGDSNKQMWLTEFGWTTKNQAKGYEYGQYNSDQDQAAYLVRAYQLAKQKYPWMGVMAMWNLNYSTIVKPEDEKYSWSIINSDYTPRPAYTALKAMPKK